MGPTRPRRHGRVAGRRCPVRYRQRCMDQDSRRLPGFDAAPARCQRAVSIEYPRDAGDACALSGAGRRGDAFALSERTSIGTRVVRKVDGRWRTVAVQNTDLRPGRGHLAAGPTVTLYARLRKSWQYLHCDATPSAVSVPQAKTRPPLGWPTAQRLPVAASALGAQHAKNAMVSTYAIRIACRPGTCPEPSRRYEFRASGIRVCSADDAGHATHGRRHDGAKSTGNPDRDFAAMMIPHHQGAIDMAKL